MNEAQRNVALFRYSLIREAADETLTIRQRGLLVRQLAARAHTGPAGRSVRIGRGTLDRWIRAYRSGGFEALAPTSRTGEPVTEQRLLDLAEALKREVPRRTAAQVTQIIRTTEGTGPSERTVQRHFARLGLNTRPDGSPPQAFGRFEAAAPGDLWTGDALHGPVIAGRKTYLLVTWNQAAGLNKPSVSHELRKRSTAPCQWHWRRGGRSSAETSVRRSGCGYGRISAGRRGRSTRTPRAC